MGNDGTERCRLLGGVWPGGSCVAMQGVWALGHKQEGCWVPMGWVHAAHCASSSARVGPVGRERSNRPSDQGERKGHILGVNNGPVTCEFPSGRLFTTFHFIQDTFQMLVHLQKLHFIENMVQWNIKCTRSISKIHRDDLAAQSAPSETRPTRRHKLSASHSRALSVHALAPPAPPVNSSHSAWELIKISKKRDYPLDNHLPVLCTFLDLNENRSKHFYNS